jgi:hypothetical protein
LYQGFVLARPISHQDSHLNTHYSSLEWYPVKRTENKAEAGQSPSSAVEGKQLMSDISPLAPTLQRKLEPLTLHSTPRTPNSKAVKRAPKLMNLHHKIGIE